MSNFFKDTSIGFKPRNNIFSKFKQKELPSIQKNFTTSANDDNNSSLTENYLPLSMINENEDENEGEENGKGDCSGTNLSREINFENIGSDENADHIEHGNKVEIRVVNRKVVDTDNTNRRLEITRNNTSTPNKLNSNVPLPTKITQQTRTPTEESELEITEIRDIPESSNKEQLNHVDDSKKEDQNLKLKNSFKRNILSIDQFDSHQINDSSITLRDTSSNDVLLEAFNDTQKICSKLKQELHTKEITINKLERKISNYENDIGKLVQKFNNHKTLLNELDGKTRIFKEQKNLDQRIIIELKQNNDNFKEKILYYKNEFSKLRISLSECNDWKKEMNNEINKKNKEILYLKKELDDFSGQLSEEKIKNSSLIKELSQNRDETLKTFDENKIYLEESFSGKIIELEKNLEKALVEKFTKPLIDNFNENSIKYNENFQRNFKTYHYKINIPFYFFLTKFILLTYKIKIIYRSNEEFVKIIEIVKDEHLKQLNENNDTVISNFNVFKVENDVSISNIFSTFKNFEESLKSKFNEIENNYTSILSEKTKILAEDLNSIANDFNSYKEKMNQKEEYSEIIKNLEKEIHELATQKMNCLTSLGTKEAEFEEITSQLNELKNKETNLLTLEKQLNEQIADLNLNVEQKNFEINKLTNENLSISSNFDNKISAQESIMKALITENDLLKQTTSKLEEERSKEENEKENTKAMVQKLNEQINKINVDLIQLKASSLEQEEENKNLHKIIKEKDDIIKMQTDNSKSLEVKVKENQSLEIENIRLQERNKELNDIKNSIMDEVSNLKDIIQKKEEDQKKLLKEIYETKRVEPITKVNSFPEFRLREEKNKNTVENFVEERNTESQVSIYLKDTNDIVTKKTTKNGTEPKKKNAQKTDICQTKNSKRNINDIFDDFELSSSASDDLEFTLPSQQKQTNLKNTENNSQVKPNLYQKNIVTNKR
ncbi:hypothetical protein TBLA_0A10250 [Henningerozyma blattae CBS 6284]|uniref:Uncharacterized protein n=1 Tax=Henningerozyma blattae (strain ATCC 34711 / CBS 6284 / DSM 70876 / NBRC 10599 / NRRL Y-10934 / UCD 77-7) TaxID=1071380 RepID=I2GXF2_HENB6|nr:hypothetical protein TBLA_0A10250 [Tetrapisispora blattae CBS 6284]CCH58804.1 hypothetical protein TBLA_0A10250 [Tetrapisispora blattae CBS 6284]